MEVNKNYFWMGSYILGSGSIIEPGNWGRMLALDVYNFVVFKEMVFEGVRRKYYSHLPSRLNSVMLCESVDAASAFRAKCNREYDLIFKVELVDPATMCFTAD